MGGRSAEELVYDTATSGAENDLKQVRKMARKMVLDWGMGDRFKHIALGEDQGSVFLGEELAKGRDYSDETARQVDDEVREISERAFQRAINALRDNREAFENLADTLIGKEEVPGEEVLRLVDGGAPSYEDAAKSNGEPPHPSGASIEDAAAEESSPGASSTGESAGEDAAPSDTGSADEAAEAPADGSPPTDSTGGDGAAEPQSTDEDASESAGDAAEEEKKA